MLIWALIGAAIGLFGFIASLSTSEKHTETLVSVGGQELDDLEEWDIQDHLEELEEEG